jgi:hypothetical protein
MLVGWLKTVRFILVSSCVKLLKNTIRIIDGASERIDKLHRGEIDNHQTIVKRQEYCYVVIVGYQEKA